MKATVLTEAYIQQIIEEETRSALLEIVDFSAAKGAVKDAAETAKETYNATSEDIMKAFEEIAQLSDKTFDEKSTACQFMLSLSNDTIFTISALGIVGSMFPLFAPLEFADVFLLFRDLCEDNYFGAMLSGLAMIPGAGAAAGTLKMAFKGKKNAKSAADILAILQESASFVRSARQRVSHYIGKELTNKNWLLGRLPKNVKDAALGKASKDPALKTRAGEYVKKSLEDTGFGNRLEVFENAVQGMQKFGMNLTSFTYNSTLAALDFGVYYLTEYLRSALESKGVSAENMTWEDIINTVYDNPSLLLDIYFDMGVIIEAINDTLKFGAGFLEYGVKKVLPFLNFGEDAPATSRKAAKEQLTVSKEEAPNFQALADIWGYKSRADLLAALGIPRGADGKFSRVELEDYIKMVNNRKPPVYRVTDIKYGPKPSRKQK